MKVQKNKKLPFVPPITMDIDDVSDLPYKVSEPLPKKIVWDVDSRSAREWKKYFAL